MCKLVDGWTIVTCTCWENVWTNLYAFGVFIVDCIGIKNQFSYNAQHFASVAIAFAKWFDIKNSIASIYTLLFVFVQSLNNIKSKPFQFVYYLRHCFFFVSPLCVQFKVLVDDLSLILLMVALLKATLCRMPPFLTSHVVKWKKCFFKGLYIYSR